MKRSWIVTVMVGACLAARSMASAQCEFTLLRTLNNPEAEMRDSFGVSVAISGDLVVVGNPGEPFDFLYAKGEAYVFSAAGGNI